MASRNVELVRAGFEAFNEGGVEGILPFIDPGFEGTTPPELASEPGLEVAMRAVQVWQLRGGKATGLELYPTLEEARAAASG